MAKSSDRELRYQRTYRASVKGRKSQAAYNARYQASGGFRRADARRAGPHRALKRFHGMTMDDWAAIYDEQGGCCYLCGGELDTEDRRRAIVEHLHDHCDPNKSCPACRRGLACARCNIVIGNTGDDPALLHRIADALTMANTAARARIAALPVQDSLFD